MIYCVEREAKAEEVGGQGLHRSGNSGTSLMSGQASQHATGPACMNHKNQRQKVTATACQGRTAGVWRASWAPTQPWCPICTWVPSHHVAVASPDRRGKGRTQGRKCNHRSRRYCHVAALACVPRAEEKTGRRGQRRAAPPLPVLLRVTKGAALTRGQRASARGPQRLGSGHTRLTGCAPSNSYPRCLHGSYTFLEKIKIKTQRAKMKPEN